ncbi:MAG: hypothetical protein MUO52_15140, partial [Desulfobacterales bacterium]|nr:hypothetical protein [Desulfobacterales bacterium]
VDCREWSPGRQADQEGRQSGTENRLALAFDREASEVCYPTQDRLEGVAAFNEKRKPKFTGR